MKPSWIERAHGYAVVSGLALRALARPRPARSDLATRLAMLPLTGAPIAEPVLIRWNEQQVPMIQANSDRDLMVALGVVHMHLRGAQIEILRMLAQGRVAEMIGPLGLGLDQSLRALDLGRAVPAMVEALPGDDRALAEGFVAGLNHGLLHYPARPVECTILGLQASPWTLSDLLLLGRLASVDISWLVWQQLLPLRRRLAPAVWQALWPRLRHSGVPAEALASDQAAARAISGLLRSGSNAVAVAGGMSRSGGGLVASDPHLPLQLPGAWLLAGWSSPGFHCVGMMMPGLPFMLLGRNPWIAWGGTSLHAQSSDLLELGVDGSEVLTSRSCQLKVRGGGDRTVQLRESRWGPIVSDGALLASPQPLALRWVGHRPSNELGAMLAVARARHVEQFRQALSGYAVSAANLVCTDVYGAIAHLRAAHLPQRSRPDPPDLLLPPGDAPGWQQLLGCEQLPMTLNPVEGFVVSANQAPAEGGPPLGYFFAPADRARRWHDLLQHAPAIDAGLLKSIQGDVGAVASLEFCQRLLAQFPAVPGGSAHDQIGQTLRGWNGEYGADSAGALAFELLASKLSRQLQARPQRQAHHAVWQYQRLLFEDLLALSPADLHRHLRRAVPWVARRLHRWRTWGGAHRLHLRHPLGYLPGWQGVAQPAPVPAAGSNSTIYKSGHGPVQGRHAASFGSCARHVSDLADPDANDFVLLGGQDGWIGSTTCSDQLKLWQQGQYLRLPLSEAAVQRDFPHHTCLLPAG